MRPLQQIELEKLTAWTSGGNYVQACSSYETEQWGRLVALGLVERATLSNINQYRVKPPGR